MSVVAYTRKIWENSGLVYQSQTFTVGDYNVSLILKQHKGVNFYNLNKDF
jgi:hypothetical protein